MKRKREDEDEEAVDGETTLDSDMLDLNAQPNAQVVVDKFTLTPSPTAPIDEAIDVVEDPADPSPRPRKRLRRVATVIGQTATAVTIGAVATWTVLAFA